MEERQGLAGWWAVDEDIDWTALQPGVWGSSVPGSDMGWAGWMMTLMHLCTARSSQRSKWIPISV
jgi:hypothetical protein